MPAYSHSELEEVDNETWQRWEGFLMPFMKQYSNGAKASPTEVVFQLHDMALELRDKLRLTLSKLAATRSELTDLDNTLYNERQTFQMQVMAYETEVQNLRAKILKQEDALSQLNCEIVIIKDENGSLKNKLHYLESERHKLTLRVEQLMRTATAATDEALNQQEKTKDVFKQLLTAKEEVTNLIATQALFESAKEELNCLEKENEELKTVIMNEKLQLGRSRLLESAGVSDAYERVGGSITNFASTQRVAAAGNIGGAGGGMGRSRKGDGEGGRGAKGGDSSMIDTMIEDAKALTFLGPPNNAYPRNPENYQFYRVGGGFTPLFDMKNPTLTKPKASGWVPKDIVRLIQAFRHSYKVKLEWPYWEPLVLMIDEIYRTRESRAIAALKQAHKERVKNVRRQIKATMPYPTIIANERISHLRQQLATSQKVLERTAYEESVMRKTPRSMNRDNSVTKDLCSPGGIPYEREESPNYRKSLNDLNQYAFQDCFRASSPRRYNQGVVSSDGSYTD